MKRNLAKKSADQKKTRGTSHVKEIEAEYKRAKWQKKISSNLEKKSRKKNNKHKLTKIS